LWTGYTGNYGYGYFSIKGRNTLAHRFSYALAFGPIPDGLYVCHNCPAGDRPACCNPRHLWLGSQADNAADMVAKGRSLYGERANGVKLTDAHVLEIRRRHAAGERPNRRIAADYGVSSDLIGLIVRGKVWRHLL
jgi:hypothetical protein